VPTNILVESQIHAVPKDDPAHIRFPGSVLARFMEFRGRRIVKACGAVWYAAPGRFLMSLPYQAMLDPRPDELVDLIRENGAAGARFPSTQWSGLDSGIYVLRRGAYDLESVHSKHRPRVRRGLETFHVRPATKAQLLSQGRAVNLSTMKRQGRYDPEFGEKRRWETLVEAAFACSEISFPAAFDGSRMAAYMITCREHRWLHILHQMSRQEDLENFPNHLLTFTVTQQGVADESLDAVCYGYAPLFANDGLHEYKQRFGYELIPHRSAFQLHPTLEPILNNSLTHAAVRVGRFLLPGSQYMETIESVLKGARSSRPLENRC
jgi:hypothetical protein